MSHGMVSSIAKLRRTDGNHIPKTPEGNEETGKAT
jgi:hypothetical protein